jgi:hypothetical protein
MSKRYYANFPQAPVDLISALAAAANIPTIVDVKVSTDNSVFIDIAQQPDEVDGFRLTAQHLLDIAEICGVEPQDLYVESLPDGDNCTLVSVTAFATPFDFTKQFVGTPWEGKMSDPRAEMADEEIEAAFENLDRVLEKYPVSPGVVPQAAKLPGEEDSEDMVEATEAIINQPREAPKDVEPPKGQ